MSDRFQIRCPDCGSHLEIDAATGAVVHNAAPTPTPEPQPDLDALLEGLDKDRARAEARFDQEMAAQRDRSRILDEKFEQARREAEARGLEGRPERPWDFD